MGEVEGGVVAARNGEMAGFAKDGAGCGGRGTTDVGGENFEAFVVGKRAPGAGPALVCTDHALERGGGFFPIESSVVTGEERSGGGASVILLVRDDAPRKVAGERGGEERGSFCGEFVLEIRSCRDGEDGDVLLREDWSMIYLRIEQHE